MGHSTASGRPQAEATAAATIASNASTAPASRRITKKDFDIRLERTGSRLAGQENQICYRIYKKGSGFQIGRNFYTKRSAEAWLGKTIKIANEIRSGRIVVERNENGRITGGHRVRG